MHSCRPGRARYGFGDRARSMPCSAVQRPRHRPGNPGRARPTNRSWNQPFRSKRSSHRGFDQPRSGSARTAHPRISRRGPWTRPDPIWIQGSRRFGHPGGTGRDGSCPTCHRLVDAVTPGRSQTATAQATFRTERTTGKQASPRTRFREFEAERSGILSHVSNRCV